MAEIIETKIAQYQYNIHKITCDKCGKHIYDSEEYDDGYYDDPGEYEQAIYIEGNDYKLSMQLCEDSGRNNNMKCEFQMWWNRFEGVKDESN